LEREKRELNKGADQETQLVTIKTSNTVENKVNIDKIRDIRMALRRRYSSRTNFGKIFKDWDISNNGEITLYDAHKMINSFGIPINYNETRALMSSSSTRNADSLDMHEFMHLIFSENQALNLDNFICT
jgi:Ca2+-binding EF-hand superfamily protein